MSLASTVCPWLTFSLHQWLVAWLLRLLDSHDAAKLSDQVPCRILTKRASGRFACHFLRQKNQPAGATIKRKHRRESSAGPMKLPSRSRVNRLNVPTRAAVDYDSTLTKAVVAAGFVANPVVLVSEYFLKTTGEGLPPGPGGLYGATEGISYLVIVGVVVWSLYTKAKTGSGLPGNLLGAVEGFSYLSLVAGMICMCYRCMMLTVSFNVPLLLVVQASLWLLWSLLKKALYLGSLADETLTTII